jgi:hypothetical protein
MARGAELGGPTAEGRGESGSSNLLGFFLTSALSACLWPRDTHNNLTGRFAPGVPAGHAGQLGCVWKGGSRAWLHPRGLKFVFGVIFSSLSPAHTLLKAAQSLAPPVSVRNVVPTLTSNKRCGLSLDGRC